MKGDPDHPLVQQLRAQAILLLPFFIGEMNEIAISEAQKPDLSKYKVALDQRGREISNLTDRAKKHTTELEEKGHEIQSLRAREGKLQAELQEKDDLIGNLEDRLESQTLRTTPRRTIGWMFVILLVVCIGVTSFVVWQGWAKEATVSIEYNVGELIAGILAGSGVAAAGGAYAIRTLRKAERS